MNQLLIILLAFCTGGMFIWHFKSQIQNYIQLLADKLRQSIKTWLQVKDGFAVPKEMIDLSTHNVIDNHVDTEADNVVYNSIIRIGEQESSSDSSADLSSVPWANKYSKYDTNDGQLAAEEQQLMDYYQMPNLTKY